MRKAYLVTYGFTKPSNTYANLYEELKRFPGWWHYIDNSWIIISDQDANGIHEKLKPYLDNDINLLVIAITNDRQGWLPKKAWEWINENLPKFT